MKVINRRDKIVEHIFGKLLLCWEEFNPVFKQPGIRYTYRYDDNGYGGNSRVLIDLPVDDYNRITVVIISPQELYTYTVMDGIMSPNIIIHSEEDLDKNIAKFISVIIDSRDEKEREYN